MASKKKDKPKKPKKDKRSKKELLAALEQAQSRLAAELLMRDLKDERIDKRVAEIEELEAKMIPAKAIAEAIRRDCPPGTRCNALVNVIYYPCGTSKVVETQRDWWLSLL